ncbi:MAG: stage V sporulation protein AE [Clostridiales bacterium GWF2_38_85]|nr:MAG: stage V sporulation protein AE [Clostridiales bacterium GWF2_38_85]HBL83607.1 stage V sporulation protein AE [Clostridiales bacterium]
MDYIKVFIVGGLFCVIAQLLIDKTKLTPARILVGYVCAGVILGALGIYKPIVEFAKAGATVPLTGFGYLLAEGVKEQIEMNGLIGALTGGLIATSGGIAAAIFFGLLWSVIFKSKPLK